MNYYRFLKTALGMSLSEALSILNLSEIPKDLEILKVLRNNLVKTYFSNGGYGQNERKVQLINAAFDVVKKNIESGSSSGSAFSDFNRAYKEYEDWAKSYKERNGRSHDGGQSERAKEWQDFNRENQERRRQKPAPWQTDPRGSSNVQEQVKFQDINYCLRDIYESSEDECGGGTYPKRTFMAFDGMYFRGQFTAFCCDKVIQYAAEVMEKWNSSGGNNYNTVAVFADMDGNNLWLLRLNGKDVAAQNVIFTHNSSNKNPGNDQQFMRKLRETLSKHASVKTSQRYDEVEKPMSYNDPEEAAEEQKRYKAEQYFSIGQNENTENNYCWAFLDGRLQVGKGRTHGAIFSHDKIAQQKAFKGWYDKDQELISVVWPGESYRDGNDKNESDIPQQIWTALRNKFGKKARIVMF